MPAVCRSGSFRFVLHFIFRLLVSLAFLRFSFCFHCIAFVENCLLQATNQREPTRLLPPLTIQDLGCSGAKHSFAQPACRFYLQHPHIRNTSSLAQTLNLKNPFEMAQTSVCRALDFVSKQSKRVHNQSAIAWE